MICSVQSPRSGNRGAEDVDPEAVRSGGTLLLLLKVELIVKERTSSLHFLHRSLRKASEKGFDQYIVFNEIST